VVVEVVDAVGDDPLDGLAALVRAHAWSRLRVEEQGPPPRWQLTLLVDGSGSMRPAIDDGSVAALVEAVVGLGAVLGVGGTPRTGVYGRPVTWLADGPGRHLAHTVETTIREGGYGVGFRPSAVELPARGDGGSAVVLITDGPPADAAELAARCARDDVRCQILVAGPEDSVRHAPPGTDGAYTVLAPPPPGRSAREHLLEPGSGAVLDAVLTSLLDSWTHAPDTQDAPR
jgi:hypothetical protein